MNRPGPISEDTRLAPPSVTCAQLDALPYDWTPTTICCA